MRDRLSHYVVQLINGKKGEGKTMLPKIKKEFGYLEFRKIILLLKNNIYYKDYFSLELFPQNINHIITKDYIPLSFNSPNVTESDLFSELECQIAFLSCFTNKLEMFAELRSGFEKALFKGDYSFAQEQLEEIRKNFGYSFWYLESLLLLSNYSMDIIKFDDMYQKTKKLCSDEYIKIFLRALRRKTNIYERFVDSNAFLSQKSDEVCNRKDIKEYKAIYFEYYFSLENIFTLTPIRFGSLLQMASHFNIIDMYLLIDRLIIYCLEDHRFEKRFDLLGIINEYNIPFCCKKACELVKGSFEIKDNKTLVVCRLKEAICCKNMDVSELNEVANLFSNSFHIIFNCLKAKIVLGFEWKNKKSAILRDLTDVLYHLTIKEGDYHLFEKIRELANRFLLVLGSTTLQYQYLNFYYDSFYSSSCNSFKDALTSDYYNRDILYYMEKIEIENQYNDCFGVFENDWNHNQIIFQKCKYDYTSETLYRISQEKIVNISYIEDIDNRNFSYIIIKNKIDEMLFYQYVNSNQILEAITLYVNLFFISKFKVFSFNNKVVDKKCRGRILKSLYPSIDFCIYAHITNFRGAPGARYNSCVASSALQILKSGDYMFPSQIKVDSSSNFTEKYIYFFRHICEKDLLISILTGYSATDNDERIRAKIVLSERIKILTIANNLEKNVHEKIEIAYQIREAKNDIAFLEKSELENTLVSSAKIFEDSIFVSDTEIIYPFFETVTKIVSDIKSGKHDESVSSKVSLFRDAFIKYKKAFIISLDQQIGINIRHGFFKDKIIEFFCQKNFAFKSLPQKKDEMQIFKLKKQKEFVSKSETFSLDSYIDTIILFSKELYSLIDQLVDEIKLNHTSNLNETNLFKIYISDDDIRFIFNAISELSNPYEFKRRLHDAVVNICDIQLSKIGEYIELKLCNECGQLIDRIYGNAMMNSSQISNDISNLKSSLPELSRQISQWFRIIRWGNERCIVKKYFLELKNKFPYITYNISRNFPKEIILNNLHYINLILSNLIMNAEEHSGLSKELLRVNISLDLEEKSTIKIFFKNNINYALTESIFDRISSLERNLNSVGTDNEERKKGNGFYHIKSELDSYIGSNWRVVFCKDDLPNSFSLFFSIRLEDDFV